MGNPLTSNQHGYVKRALHSFETVAEALDRIADSVESTTGSDTEADTETEEQRTEIVSSGRYDEITIEGVLAQSVAIDHDKEPSELLVHADSVRHPTPMDGEVPTHVLKLPSIETPGSEN